MYTKIAGITFRELDYLKKAVAYAQTQNAPATSILTDKAFAKLNDLKLILPRADGKDGGYVSPEAMDVLTKGTYKHYVHIKEPALEWMWKNQLLFPWNLLTERDACTMFDDPNGTVTGNAHTDPNAMAVVQTKHNVWIGFLQNNDNTDRTADKVRSKLASGAYLHSCIISGLTGGEGGKNRGINLEIEFGEAGATQVG